MLAILKNKLHPFGGYRFDLGGGGGSQTSTTTVQQYSPEEAARRAQLMDTAMSVYNNTKGNYETPPIALNAKPSDETKWAELMLGNAAGNAQNNLVNPMLQNYNYLSKDALNVKNNPYFQGAVEAATRPMVQEFSNSGGVLSNIRSGAGDAGQYGSSRQGIAEGLAMQGLQQNMGDVEAKMGSAAYGQGLDAASKALSMSGMVGDTMKLPAQWMSAIGDAKDARAQAELNRDAQVTAWNQNKDWMPLNNLANVIYGGGSSQSTTNATMPAQQESGMSKLGTMAGIGGSIMSMMGSSY